VSQSDFVSRGQALVAAGQFQEAVKVCRLGLLGRPTTVEGRVVLGQALHALKRYDEVLAEMRVALELDHTSVPAHALKAEALLRKGDTQAAIEALHEARKLAPGDPRIMQLLGEAEHGPGKRPSTSHPAVGFVGGGDTKHYPNHADGGIHDPDASEGFTKPTSISTPASIKRTSERRAAEVPLHKDPTPSPAMLAVGDKSGTVEVDPEMEGVELEDDLDFDDLAAPPISKSSPRAVAPRAATKAQKKKLPGPKAQPVQA
jgi:tetratricopeptide (TPR) repeat protein